MKPDEINSAADLASAVQKRQIRTDAVALADGGFAHPDKQLEINPDMVGLKVRPLHLSSYSVGLTALTATGRRCWSYSGVGNCYETLNPDGTINGWWSTAYIKPAYALPTVREINSHLAGGSGYCYVSKPRQDGIAGGDRVRIIRARTRNRLLEGKALASGKWEHIPLNSRIELS